MKLRAGRIHHLQQQVVSLISNSRALLGIMLNFPDQSPGHGVLGSDSALLSLTTDLAKLRFLPLGAGAICCIALPIHDHGVL